MPPANPTDLGRPCANYYLLADAILDRLLVSARHAGYHSDVHVPPIRQRLLELVDKTIVPGLIEVASNSDPDMIEEEAPGHWLCDKSRISTDKAEVLYSVIRKFVACIHKGSRNDFLRRKTVNCLISLRSVQKKIDYRALFSN